MYFINFDIQSKAIEFRQAISSNLYSDIRQMIIWFSDLINVELVDLQMNDLDVMSVNGLISAYEIKYKLRDKITNELYEYKTTIPKFIGNYIIINGQRYSFVYSIADKFLSKFGSDRVDGKLSNLYRKVVFKNVLDEHRIITYESKHKTLPIINFVLLYILRSKEMLSEVDASSLMNLLYDLFTENNYKVTLEDIEVDTDVDNSTSNISTKRYTKRKKIITGIEVITVGNTIRFVDYATKKQLIIDVDLESNYRSRLAMSFKDYGGNTIIERLLGKRSYETANLLYGELYAIFDPLVRQELGDPDTFITRFIFTNDFASIINDCPTYNSLGSKIIRLKTFYMHPLIRQLMHLLYERIRTKRLPKKHTTTLSMLYKAMQIEYVEDKIHNPISEVMILLKATYAHKFALRRLSHNIRLITDMVGIVDPIVTPESKKIGSVNYITLQYGGPID